MINKTNAHEGGQLIYNENFTFEFFKTKYEYERIKILFKLWHKTSFFDLEFKDKELGNGKSLIYPIFTFSLSVA